MFYLQQNTSTGCWNLNVVSGGGTISSSTTPTLDTNWHHFEIGFTGSTVYLFIDGILQGSAASTFNGTRETNPFCVHAFSTGNFRFNGLVDEVAVWNSCLHTTAFTPPSAATSDSASGLRALYHLDDNANDSASAAPADTTAPILTAATGSATGANTASGTVSTDEANGTLYWLASTSSTETAAAVKAGSSKSVSATGSQSVTASSLSASTLYYLHYLHRDAAGNDSAVASSPSFTTTATTDTTAPTLSSPTGTKTGSTTASGTVSTNEANGTLYRFASTNASETAATVKTANLTSAVTTTGVQNVSFSGLAAATQYYAHYVHRDAAGNDSAVASSAAFTTDSVAAPATGFTDNILFSPCNWDVTGTSAFSNHSGAYFRTIFSGNSCVLSFDITGIQYLADVIEYRVDADDWVLVPLAASVTISIPSRLAWGASSVHLLEVRINKFSFDNTRWVDPVEGVKLTGIALDSGATLSKPAALPQSVLVYGDSITEGFRTIDAYLAVTSRHSWAYVMAEVLGVELGMAAFTGQGFTKIGNGNIPALPSTYDKLYPGKDRTFNPAPDLIVINMGTNDPYNQATIDAAVGVVNGLLAKTPSTTKISVLRLFGGRATEMQAVVATVNSPRVSYIDTGGFFVPTAASGEDRIHPRAFDNRIIGPRMAAAVKPLLPATTSAPPATSARTVTLTLGDDSGALANLTGMKVSFYDEPTPDLHTVPRFKAANVTTNASGVMTLAVQSTLAVGGSGSVVVQMADGRNLVRTVTVA